MNIKPTLWKTIISILGGVTFYFLLVTDIIKCPSDPCFYTKNFQFFNIIDGFVIIYLTWSIFQRAEIASTSKNIPSQTEEKISNINIFKNTKNESDLKFVIINLIISLAIMFGLLLLAFLIAKYGLKAPDNVYLSFLKFNLNLSNILTFVIIFIVWSLFRKNRLRK